LSPMTGFFRDGCCDTSREDIGAHGVEALQAGRAPRVVLRATHEGALSFCSLADLKRLAVDLD